MTLTLTLREAPAATVHVEALYGDLLRVDVAHDPAVEDVLRDRFEERYTVEFDSYPVSEPWLLEPARRVDARPAA